MCHSGALARKSPIVTERIMIAAESNRHSVLLCDLDGTLIDSAPDLASALASLLKEEGQSPVSLKAVKGMVGDGAAKLVERAFTLSGETPTPATLTGLTDRFLQIYETMLAVDTVVFPGVKETLAALKADGWRLAVCTNKPEQASREVIEALGLNPLFDAIAGGDSYATRKPDPGHILSLLGQLDASPEMAILVGDSLVDVAAARNAGVAVIAVSYGYRRVPASELGADVLIDAFAELPAALNRLSPPRLPA